MKQTPELGGGKVLSYSAMPLRFRLRNALFICLPILVTFMVGYFMVRGDRYGDTMSLAIFFGLPIMILGLPWSLINLYMSGILETAFLSGQISKGTAEYFAIILGFISLLVNATFLLQMKPFSDLFRWACILGCAQLFAYLLFR